MDTSKTKTKIKELSQLETSNLLKDSTFESLNWYKAITIKERILSLNTFRVHTPIDDEVDVKTAEQRLQCWRSQYPFNINTYFQKRLTNQGVSEEDFLKLISESTKHTQIRFSNTPHWLKQIRQAFCCSSYSKSNSLPKAFSGKGMLRIFECN